MTVRTLIMSAVVIIPVFGFNISCEKKQPITAEATMEPSVQDSVGEPPSDSGSLQGEGEDSGEGEDMGYESEKDEGQHKGPGFEPQQEDAVESYEPEEEGEDEDAVYGSDVDEQA